MLKYLLSCPECLSCVHRAGFVADSDVAGHSLDKERGWNEAQTRVMGAWDLLPWPARCCPTEDLVLFELLPADSIDQRERRSRRRFRPKHSLFTKEPVTMERHIAGVPLGCAALLPNIVRCFRGKNHLGKSMICYHERLFGSFSEILGFEFQEATSQSLPGLWEACSRPA